MYGTIGPPHVWPPPSWPTWPLGGGRPGKMLLFMWRNIPSLKTLPSWTLTLPRTWVCVCPSTPLLYVLCVQVTDDPICAVCATDKRLVLVSPSHTHTHTHTHPHTHPHTHTHRLEGLVLCKCTHCPRQCWRVDMWPVADHSPSHWTLTHRE